ncbi:MAG: response regulator, partial [Gammaproteobacteria bacterium]
MTSAKLLVVDDDRTTAAVLCAQIEMLGFAAPLLAVDSRSALQLAQSKQPDLILMDIQLGAGIDGIDTARTIQEELHIPVIYVTAHADGETLARARDTRPMGYINKPLREIDLRTTLELALSEITQRKNLLPGSALSNTLNCISTGVVLLDSNLTVSFINQMARDILEHYDDLLL